MPRSTTHRLRRLTSTLPLMLMLLSTMPGWVAAGDQPLLVKASFVLNFMKFTEWPTAVMAQADEEITLAVVGDDPLFEAMITVMKGKSVHGRGIRIQTYANINTWMSARQRFHAVFFDKTALEKLADLQSITAAQAVLTIGDHPGFCAAGGMLNLFEDNGRIRFEANQDAARSAGLAFQSQMLNLAVVVKTVAKE